MAGELNDLATNCPHTNILLAGPSQGATIITNVIGEYGGSAWTHPSVAQSVLNHISAVMLFGDPGYRPGEAWDAAGNGTGHGVFEDSAGEVSNMVRLKWLPPSYTLQGYVTVVRSYCFSGDMFCHSNPAGLAIHGSYGASSAMLDAWAFCHNAMTDFA